MRDGEAVHVKAVVLPTAWLKHDISTEGGCGRLSLDGERTSSPSRGRPGKGEVVLITDSDHIRG